MEDAPAKNPNMRHSGKRRKFWGVCAACIRWLFIVLFAVILLGGLYFRAPWKILVLDAFLLGLLTVVPRSWRKYGWGILVLAATGIIFWIFLPELDSSAWKPYIPKEQINAFNNQYTVPDEENAAIVYDRLFEKITQVCISDEHKDYYDNLYYPGYQRLDEEKVQDWLKNNEQEVYDTLKTASLKDQCYWPMDTYGDTVNYTYMSALKYTLRFVAMDISHNIQNRNYESALEKLSWGFACAAHLKQQPNRMYYLIGLAIEGMYYRTAWDMIVTGSLTKAQLADLAKLSSLNTHDRQAIVDRLVEYETLRNKVKYTSYLYEINEYGRTRFSGNLMGIKVNILDRWFMMPSLTRGIENPFWRKCCSKLSRVINGWYVPSSPEDLMAMFDEHRRYYYLTSPFVGNRDMLPEISWKTAQLNCDYLIEYNILLYVEASEQIYYLDRRIESAQVATRIMLAAREYFQQYNAWPETLEVLKGYRPNLNFTDPLNGQDYVYQKNDVTFILYSKGLNGIDEDGSQKDGADDWLFWPEWMK